MIVSFGVEPALRFFGPWMNLMSIWNKVPGRNVLQVEGPLTWCLRSLTLSQKGQEKINSASGRRGMPSITR